VHVRPLTVALAFWNRVKVAFSRMVSSPVDEDDFLPRFPQFLDHDALPCAGDIKGANLLAAGLHTIHVQREYYSHTYLSLSDVFSYRIMLCGIWTL